MASRVSRQIVFWFLLCVARPVIAAERPLVVAYVPNWINLRVFAETLPYERVTHLNVAFENPTDDDGTLSSNRGSEALIAKAHAAGVKVLVSIGGGSAAEDRVLKPRYHRLIAEPRRAAFVELLVEYVVAHDFDGLDLDLEGPSINEDYGPFVADLAPALRAKGKLLTAALAHEYGGSRVPAEAFAHFDFISIMAYDAAGPWAPKRPGPHSSMAFAKRSVDYWLKRGVPREKAVLGVPFYGFDFGPNAKKASLPYRRIVAEHPGAELTDEAGDQIFYNGIPTIRAKAKYVLAERLGGMMIWSLDLDAAGDLSLLKAMHEELRPAKAEAAAPR